MSKPMNGWDAVQLMRATPGTTMMLHDREYRMNRNELERFDEAHYKWTPSEMPVSALAAERWMLKASIARTA